MEVGKVERKESKKAGKKSEKIRRKKIEGTAADQSRKGRIGSGTTERNAGQNGRECCESIENNAG